METAGAKWTKRRTYVVGRADEVVGAGDARHRVAVEEALDDPLDVLVPAHERDVGGVES